MPEEGMDDHAMCVTMVAVAARGLSVYDIEGAIENAERSLAVSPLFHPTAWIENHKKLEEDLEVLKAALPLVRLAKRLASPAAEIS